MQIGFIPYLIFHIYKSEKSGGWVGMVGGVGNKARGVKQYIADMLMACRVNVILQVNLLIRCRCITLYLSICPS